MRKLFGTSILVLLILCLSTPAFADASVTSSKSNYMASLNYINKLESNIIDASTKAESMNAYAKAIGAWDNEINRIYGYLKKKLPSDKMNALRKDELNWIKMRDNAIDAGPGIIDMGKMLSLTKKRTLYLIDMYFSK